jgi:hypothetical protein
MTVHRIAGPGYEQHLDDLAKHYAKLLGIPGWSDYAKDRVARMVKEAHGLYRDLPARIAAVKEKAK